MDGITDQGYDPSPSGQPRVMHAAPASGYDFNRISGKKDLTGYQEQDLYGSSGVAWKGRAIASLVIGIAGVFLMFGGLVIPCIGWLPLPMASIGLGLGISALMSMKHANSRGSFGLTIAGIIINGVVLALSILAIILIFMFFASSFSISSGTIIRLI